MASYNDGKLEVVAWILERVPERGHILDVGACDGKWADLIRDKAPGIYMDAVEIFKPHVPKLLDKYDAVYVGNIMTYQYAPHFYDMIIFGDVLEHMTPAAAKFVLHYARKRVPDYVIGVPFLYKQGPLYGNPYERHIQDDLTPELFAQRYPGHELILRPRRDYAYYHWSEK